MNRDRRKLIGNIFADSAKYILTAGIIGNFLSGKFTLFMTIGSLIVFGLLVLFAYLITPKDKEEI